MIVVTGATGTVGSRLVTTLTAAGADVRAVIPEEQQPPTDWGADVQTVVADLAAPASLSLAAQGADAIYLLVPTHQRMADYQCNMIDAVARTNSRPRVVLHTAAGFTEHPRVRFLAAHAEGFAHLQASGLPWTVLAPNGFLQNVLGMAAQLQDGVLALPAGDAPVSYVDASDVAAAAATVLTGHGHDHAVYTLTGPEPLTHARIAQHLGHILQRPVRYQPVSAEQARTRMRQPGQDPWPTEGMIELFGLYASGAAATVTDHLPRLLGRPATSLTTFLAANPQPLPGRS